MNNQLYRVAQTLRTIAGTRGRRTAGSPRPSEPLARFEELEPRTMMSSADPGLSELSLVTPTGLTVLVAAPHSVQLAWSDADANAAGYVVLRSDNGGGFTQVSKVAGGKVHKYTDSKAASNHNYRYEVEAYKGTTLSGASDAASVKTPLVAPSSLTTAALGTSSVQLKWKDNDPAATGYRIMRSTDGGFAELATVSGGAAAAYLDSTAASGTVYSYEVRAFTGDNASAYSAVAKAATPLTAPGSLHATPAATSVSLTWSGIDPHATSVIVLRSLNGKTFTKVVTLGPGATGYTNTGLTTGTTYIYRVQATSAKSPAGTSDALQTATLILAPTSLAANVSGTQVNLTWSDPNRAGMGYLVLRSSDGSSYSQIAALAAGAAKKFTDSTAAANHSFSYRIEAAAGGAVSDHSNTATIATPDGTASVTISSRYGNELVITAYGSADSISVSESGGTLTIVADGHTFNKTATDGGLFIYDRGGSGSISIDASVTVRTTITSLGGGATMVSSGSDGVSAWIDSTDTFVGDGSVHRIGSLAGGVSKAAGAALANPGDAGKTFKLKDSLWGTGPVADDVNQGGVGDCYFLSSLAAFAETDPSRLADSAADMGDGTYVVQLFKQSSPTFIRVSNDISIGDYWGYKYARPGADNTMWAPILEKAFAYFRTSAHTYAAISSGWMGEAYSALGISSSSFSLQTSENSFYTMLMNDLNNGRAVTFGTTGSAPNLVRGHAYTLMGVSTDEHGVTHYTVRNPWGMAGDSLENSAGYATLTFAQMQANFSAGAQAA